MAYSFSDENFDPRTAQAALAWYVDQGVDEALDTQPGALCTMAAPAAPIAPVRSSSETTTLIVESTNAAALSSTTQWVQRAQEAAASAHTLEELAATITAFEGLSIKKTATHMVFADGNPAARVMVIGDCPGAEEDKTGSPFIGAEGQLLDKMLASIGLARQGDSLEKCVYLTNVLNWRPPGNRTPNEAEIAISRPFIMRHIALIAPKILIVCGAVAAKAVLNRDEGISRLRGTWYPVTVPGPGGEMTAQAMAIYSPGYLIKTPNHKKIAWQDLLAIQALMQG